MSDTVVITGATGFIGSHLARKLSEMGRPVRCLIRSSSRTEFLEGLDIEAVVTDLSDQRALEKHFSDAQTVYHVAGRVAGTEQELRQANVDCAAHIAQACAKQDAVPKLLLISSLAAAGPSTKEHPKSAQEQPNPISSYGKSKLDGEEATREFAADVPVTIVRPSIVYGPYDRQFAQLFRAMRLFRFNPLVGFHDPPLSMIHVTDLIDLLIAAENQGKSIVCDDRQRSGEGVYFAAYPEPSSMANVGRLARPLLKRPFAPMLPIPIPAAYCGAIISETACKLLGQQTLFNVDKIREASQPAWTCETSKSQEELHWEAHYSTENGFAETIDWYFKNRWL